MTNLVPEVFIVPFPLTPWAVPHASQTQQTPNQTQSEWLISQPVLPGSIISAKTTGLVAGLFPLTEVPPTFPPCHILPLCCPLYSATQSLLLCPGRTSF